VRLSELLVESSEVALRLQRSDGSFPAGFNGPLGDPETPVRNTAHWLLTSLKAHEISGALRFRDAAARAADYLAAPGLRPAGATFLCRTNSRKDLCNGLVGQAWAIEALLGAAEGLGEPRYRLIAAEVFEQHPFDDTLGLWRVRHVDGQCGEIHRTFNQQLWFAAAGARLDGAPQGDVGRRVHRFLDGAGAHLDLVRSGPIRHLVVLPRPPGARVSPRRWIRRLKSTRRWLDRARRYRREIGYHAFNLHAFARLWQRIPAHGLWQDPRFGAALRFVGLDEYTRGLEGNEFAYGYNPVGFEVALALQVFVPPDAARAALDAWWVGRQLARTYDRNQRLMHREAPDPTTLAARLYEACWLRDVSIPDAE
jgi:hypothetical protein